LSIEPPAGVDPIPMRPIGYFAVKAADPMVALANAAPLARLPEAKGKARVSLGF